MYQPSFSYETIWLKYLIVQLEKLWDLTSLYGSPLQLLFHLDPHDWK